MDIWNNVALQEVASVWLLDGDLMKCRMCLIASRDGEEFHHHADCKHKDKLHPWQELRDAMSMNQSNREGS